MLLRMVDVEFIKLRYERDGWPIHESSRRSGLSRQPIPKALAGHAAPPYSELSALRSAPVIGPYLGFVRQWLAEEEDAPMKQRYTAWRIYERLVDERGYPGSEATMRHAVASLRTRRAVPYVPLEAPLGKIAQADLGSAVVVLVGERVEVALFCLRAKASRVSLVAAYPTERLEAFLAGHVEAFTFFDGVVAEMWYDNPLTAVTKILAGRRASSTSSSARYVPTTSLPRASARRGPATRRARSSTWSAARAATRPCPTRVSSSTWPP